MDFLRFVRYNSKKTRKGARSMMYVNYDDPQEVVEAAKALLMQHRRMTEPEAHRYLQMQAMNRRLNKRTVAIQIIHQYKSCVTAS